jgi:uncharacterized protein YbaP (TraB family)
MNLQLLSNTRKLLSSLFILGGLLFAFNASSFELDCKLEQLYSQKSTGILYQIKSDSMPTSFLFGTMHAGYSKFQELPETVKNAMSQSQIYLTESPIGNEARANINSLLYLEEGQTLSAILRHDVYEKYKAWLNRIKAPIELQEKMERWTPAYIVGLISSLPSEIKSLERFDVMMLKVAVGQSLEIMSVENSYEWRQGLNNMTNEDWSNVLKEALEVDTCPICEKESLHYIRCSLEFVRTGNAAELFSLQEKFLSSRPAAKVEKEKTIYARNQHQANNIIKLLRQQAKSMFFTVGADHIGGPQGVVQRLRDKGYVVEQVK